MTQIKKKELEIETRYSFNPIVSEESFEKT